MPFLLKDETASVNIIYIDDSGQIGIMGSANAGQMLSFAGLGLVKTSGYMADGVAGPGSTSPLAGTIVIPISSSGSVTYSTPQMPTVSATTTPTTVSTSSTTWNNTSTSSSQSVTYSVW